MRPTTSITAHSGCEETLRDSRESVEEGIRLCADMIEVDVRRAPDSTLVISHDAREDYEGYLTLDEAMRLIAASDKIGINCDIKEAAVLDGILALADRHSLPKERIVLSGSLTPTMLQANPAIASRTCVYLNIEQILCERCTVSRSTGMDETQAAWKAVSECMSEMQPHLEFIIETCSKLGAAALNLPLKPFTEHYFAHLSAKLPLSVWTIDEPSQMKRMFELGVCNLTTRKVRMASEIRGY